MYPGIAGILVSNLSVALCPNEKDLESFIITTPQILRPNRHLNMVR